MDEPMAKRGKTPSLIGGTHGSVRFDESGRKHPCKRCGAPLVRGAHCVRVSKPGQMGNGRTYCLDCFNEVLTKTNSDLAELRERLYELQAQQGA